EAPAGGAAALYRLARRRSQRLPDRRGLVGRCAWYPARRSHREGKAPAEPCVRLLGGSCLPAEPDTTREGAAPAQPGGWLLGNASPLREPGTRLGRSLALPGRVPLNGNARLGAGA